MLQLFDEMGDGSCELKIPDNVWREVLDKILELRISGNVQLYNLIDRASRDH